MNRAQLEEAIRAAGFPGGPGHRLKEVIEKGENISAAVTAED